VRNDSGTLKVLANGCAKALAGFERKPLDTAPKVEGRPAELKDAIARAAAILKKAKRPLFAGLATDVDCMREVMTLADRTGSVVDHMHTDAMMRNVRVVQRGGWITTTMAEVRNRADFMLFVGTSAINDYPRFYERLLWAKETLYGMKASDRQYVYLGRGLEIPKMPEQKTKPTHLPCPPEHLFDVLAAIRALVNGHSLQAKLIAGIKRANIESVVARMKAARYAVIVWDGGKLDFPNSDLIVQLVTEIVRDMNRYTRTAGFPLVGNNGGASAQSVCAWQTGFPLRMSLQSGHPEYDPIRFSAASTLARGEVDAMVWISTVTAGRTPPDTKLPTIVLAEPGMQFTRKPTVYIPVGSPSLDHGGRLVRCDNVVSLPMRGGLRHTGMPSVADVMTALQQAI
jgi:formylmethanofuran dehydrogenase subunit B